MQNNVIPTEEKLPISEHPFTVVLTDSTSRPTNNLFHQSSGGPPPHRAWRTPRCAVGAQGGGFPRLRYSNQISGQVPPLNLRPTCMDDLSFMASRRGPKPKATPRHSGLGRYCNPLFRSNYGGLVQVRVSPTIGCSSCPPCHINRIRS